MRYGLKLSHLRTFVAVIDGKSFSAAAASLGLTQPAVSLQMRRLEKGLGVRLIERIGKRALPTPAAHEFLEFARHTANLTDEAIRRARQYAEGGVGQIRIGTGATACTYLLPNVLKSLRRARPKLKIMLITGNTFEMLDGVERNLLDLAVVTLPAVRRKLVIRELIEDPLVAIFPPEYKVLLRSVRPDEMSRYPLILYEPQGNVRSLIDRWFSLCGVGVQPAMEVGSVEATKKFVASGFGCSIVPSMAVREKSNRGLFSVRSLMPHASRRLGLAARHDKLRDSTLRATILALEKAGI
jgi:DNA-binding transcriptional LysR family regulator